MKKSTFSAVIALFLPCFLILPALCACVAGDEISKISRESEESSTPVQLDVISWISLSEDDAARKEYSKTPAEYTLPELDTVTVRFDGKRMQCLYEQDEVYELPVTELINAYFADLNGDGVRELCCTAKTTERSSDEYDTLSYRGWAYDLVSKQLYSTAPSSDQGFGWVLRAYENEIYAMPWSFVQYVYAEPAKIALDEQQQVLTCEGVSLPHEVVESFCYWPVNPYNLLIFNIKEDGEENMYYVLLEENEAKAFEQILAAYEYEKTTDPGKSPLADLIVYDACANIISCKARFRFGRDLHLFEEYASGDWYLAEDHTAAEDYIKGFAEDALPYYQ